MNLNENDGLPLSGTIESRLNHLHARSEAQIYRIGKNTDCIERMEKTLEKVTDALLSQTKLLSDYNSSLREHMARSDYLEQKVELLREAHTNLPLRLLQIISILGGTLALAKMAI